LIDELTSRKDSTDIPNVLDHLEVAFDPQSEAKRKEMASRPIDVLLATNMVSVGVDVQRLGLMVVGGQPKTTAEYILKWVPTSEIRGEGVFLHFSEGAIEAWVKKTKERENEFFEAHRRWRQDRGLEPSDGFPTMRYVLLHSLAYALIRQFAVECGYTTASIRERIYSRPPGGDHEPMAGILLYTAAPDSEGTLGGLVPWAIRRHSGGTWISPSRRCGSAPRTRCAPSTTRSRTG